MNQIESLYIHVPFCKHLCNYCDFYKRKLEQSDNQLLQFNQFLNQSWEQHLQLMNQHGLQWGALKTLYLGGGTPSLWSYPGIKFLAEWFKQRKLVFAADYEWTIEVDPDAWSPEEIQAWLDLGVNRISIGSQSFNDTFLTVLDRQHKMDDIESLCDHLKRRGVNFSIDFMIGIPEMASAKRNIFDELNRALEFQPKHISLYILTVRKNYAHVHSLPLDEGIAHEYLEVDRFLVDRGYGHYEVSNYALPGFESQHNLAYWKSQTVAGLGPTATGFFNLKGKGIRYKWKVQSPAFELEELNPEQMLIEKIYLEMRTHFPWSPREWGGRQGEIEKLMQNWISEGFICQTGAQSYRTLPRGFILIDTLVPQVLKYT